MSFCFILVASEYLDIKSDDLKKKLHLEKDTGPYDFPFIKVKERR
jgi:hypothetical protein